MFKHQKSGKGYKLHFINDKNLYEYLDNIPKNFYKLRPAHKADYVRVSVVNKYGGIWLDSDMIIINSLDFYFDLLNEYNSFFYRQIFTPQKEKFEISFFGSKKDNPILIEWISMSNRIIANTTKLSWEEIGQDLLQQIYWEYPNLFENAKILDAKKQMYPVDWKNCVDEFCLKPYDNYINLIPEERCDVIMLVNSVYKHLKDMKFEDIISSKMPLNYFINESLLNYKD
jgi:hypothetical protein